MDKTHNRLEICKEFQEGIIKRVDKVEDKITSIEISQSASNEKLDNVCIRMENLTKAIWGLVSSVVIMFLSFIVSIIMKII